MRTIVRTVSLATVLIASLAALVPARTAQAAADPSLMVSRQITAIETMTDRVHTQMVRVCQNTVATIERLDARSVANAKITPVGNRGLVQIDAIGNKTELALERGTAKIVLKLQRLNADQTLIDQLNAAMAQARTDLNASETETKAPISAALETATSN
jgi:hypothetical protein